MLWMLACTSPAPVNPSETTPSDPPTTPSTPSTPDPTDETPTVPQGPENVLLVMIDDIGTEKLAAYGSVAGPPTPTLDGLAAEGMLFQNAWSMPLCSAARGSLLTGRYPTRSGVGSVAEVYGGLVPDGVGLVPEQRTIPEMLGEAWDSSLAGKWHVRRFVDDPDWATDPGLQGYRWYGHTASYLEHYDVWEKSDNGAVGPMTTYATTDSADDAIDRMGAMTEPWFMHLAFHAAHRPYEAPPESLVPGNFRTDEQKYDAMVQGVDIELGRVLASLDPEVRARTTVLVMGDNGLPAEINPDLDPDRLKATVYQGGIRVPLIVAGPRVAEPGAVTDALVSLVDVFPTLEALAEIAPDAEAPPIDGVSFLPVLADPEAEIRNLVYSEGVQVAEGRTFAIRDGQYKLLGWQGFWGWAPHDAGLELYDLVADPGETENLVRSDAHAETFERLLTEAIALQEEMQDDPLAIW